MTVSPLRMRTAAVPVDACFRCSLPSRVVATISCQTLEGRLVGRLDPVFKSVLGVREAQVIQESLDLVRVLLVPGDGLGPADEAALRRALRGRLGDVQVSVEYVSAIPRSPNGKFRAVISRLTPRREIENAPLTHAAAGVA